MEQAIKEAVMKTKAYDVGIALYTIIFIGAYWYSLYKNLFFTTALLDNFFHGAGGVWVAAIFLLLLRRWKLNDIENRYWIRFIFGVAFVTCIGVLWEFHEYLGDLYLEKRVLLGGVEDTMGDIFMDMIGGAIFLLIPKYFVFSKNDMLTE